MFPKFCLLFFLASCAFTTIVAQSNERSHLPLNYNSNQYLSDPLPNLEVLFLPNPTYDTATFEYELKEAGEVSFRIYNDLGHKIDEPFKEYKEAGKYTLEWSPLNLNLKGGVYYARMGLGDKYRLLKVRYIK